MKGAPDRIEQLVADVGDIIRPAIDEIVRERIGALLSSVTDATPPKRGRPPGQAAKSKPTRAAKSAAPTKAGSGRRCRLCRETGHRADKCPKSDDAEDE